MKKKSVVDKAPKVDQLAEQMRSAGYLSTVELAGKIQISVPSLRRWADDGEVESLLHANRRFLKVSSVIAKIGPERAKIFGLTETKAVGARK